MWRLPVCLFSRLLKKDGSGSVECTARQSVSQSVSEPAALLIAQSPDGQ